MDQKSQSKTFLVSALSDEVVSLDDFPFTNQDNFFNIPPSCRPPLDPPPPPGRRAAPVRAASCEGETVPARPRYTRTPPRRVGSRARPAPAPALQLQSKTGLNIAQTSRLAPSPAPSINTTPGHSPAPAPGLPRSASSASLLLRRAESGGVIPNYRRPNFDHIESKVGYSPRLKEMNCLCSRPAQYNVFSRLAT